MTCPPESSIIDQMNDETPYDNPTEDIIKIEYNSKEEILKITEKQAYEWVKTGVWNFKTFQNWLDHVVSDAEEKAIYYQNL